MISREQFISRLKAKTLPSLPLTVVALGEAVQDERCAAEAGAGGAADMDDGANDPFPAAVAAGRVVDSPGATRAPERVSNPKRPLAGITGLREMA